MRPARSITLSAAGAFLLAPLLAYSQAGGAPSTAPGSKTGAGAPIYRVGLNVHAPKFKPGGARPTLTVYPIDASGKPDEKIQHADRITCSDPTCWYFALPGTRVEVVSNLPVRAWTGTCAGNNPSAEPRSKCILTLERKRPGATPYSVGATLE